jgi:predicted dehydrogenase
MDKLSIGVVGAGDISRAYLETFPAHPIIEVLGIASEHEASAKARAAEFGLTSRSTEELLRDSNIEMILNLTPPGVHADITAQALQAGKHVYSEKPLALDVAQARALLELAERNGVRIGCAPDTFMGAGQQTCRSLIDHGLIGDPIAGTAFFMGPGHERHHPNPAFYYAKGGGPMLDMGPYYLTALVNLIGPVARVCGEATRSHRQRRVQRGPRQGTEIRVDVDTHIAGTLEFVSGAVVSIAMSFEVYRHCHTPLELYGTKGSLVVPDPNRFGGTIRFAGTDDLPWQEQALEFAYRDGEFRGIGLVDMAQSIRANRGHRASGDLAFHVLEVMEGIQTSSDTARHIVINSRPDRPPPLPASGLD